MSIAAAKIFAWTMSVEFPSSVVGFVPPIGSVVFRLVGLVLAGSILWGVDLVTLRPVEAGNVAFRLFEFEPSGLD